MKPPLRRILRTTLLLIAASLLLHGCATHHRRPPPREKVAPEQEQGLPPGPEIREETITKEPAPPGREALPDLKPQKGPAHALYREAEQAMRKGEYKQAGILLERALRVEPRNGWYWHAMGRVQYGQGSYAQAIQFCLKSDSMAGRDSDLKRYNRLLVKMASSNTGTPR
jgi:predicted Zn-dependent protease